jgi:pyrimidine-specific ribonucleoside hydrolase
LSFCLPGSREEIFSAVARILKGETTSLNQVMKVIPVDTSFYMTDVQPYMSDIINNHGMDEWSSGVLANELHRHLGVFAIIGVKMGILAREYFHIGVDEMKVNSNAGSIPPLSCMNDGLQVSTGATSGHGLLKVNDENCSPSAEFTFHDVTLKISLKQEIADKITKELQELNFVYGLDSNIYWELVRQRSLLYWKNLGRYDIFEITEIK